MVAIAQICPCESDWKNHRRYHSCVKHAAHNLIELGVLSSSEGDDLIREAKKSRCGKSDRHKKGKKGKKKGKKKAKKHKPKKDMPSAAAWKGHRK